MSFRFVVFFHAPLESKVRFVRWHLQQGFGCTQCLICTETTCALTSALTDVFESVSLVAPGRSAGDLFAASPSGLVCSRGAVSPSHKSSESAAAA